MSAASKDFPYISSSGCPSSIQVPILTKYGHQLPRSQRRANQPSTLVRPSRIGPIWGQALIAYGSPTRFSCAPNCILTATVEVHSPQRSAALRVASVAMGWDLPEACAATRCTEYGPMRVKLSSGLMGKIPWLPDASFLCNCVPVLGIVFEMLSNTPAHVRCATSLISAQPT